MPYPIQTQVFSVFMGTQEGIHSVALPAIYSSSGSRNLWIDKLGRAKKILGYSKQNSSAVTTNTGGAATRLRALRAYRQTGASFTRQLIGVFEAAASEYELWYSTNDGAAWTFIVDLGSGSVGSIPDFAQVDNTLFFANGVVAPRAWDGSALSTAGASAKSPTPTAAVNTASGQLNGTYTFKLISIEADGTRHAGSVTSNSLQYADEQCDLTWSADGDSDVTGYELYRTTGTGSTFYFVTFIDVRTTTSYTDNASDLDILENRSLQEHGDAPPTGSYFCEPHKQRLWWGRTNTNPRRVYWSDPGLPDQVGVDNYIDFTDQGSVGDVITALSGDYQGALVVFCERSIWTVSGTGQIVSDNTSIGVSDWTRTKSNAVIGAVSHRSVVQIPAGAVYTDSSGDNVTTGSVMEAYFTPLGDIRLFDGNNDVVISTPVKETLKTFLYAQRNKIHAVHDVENAHVVWFWPGPTPSGDQTENNQAVVWNYRWGVWYVWPDMPMAASTTIETSSDIQIVLTGEAQTSKGGFCYKFFNGDSFDGSNIPSRWITKVIYGTDNSWSVRSPQTMMAYVKRFRWLDIIAQAESDVTLTIEWMSGASSDEAVARGGASQSIEPLGLQLITDDGNGIQTDDESNITLPFDSVQKIINLEGTSGDFIEDVGCRIRISDDAQNGSWSLEGMTLGYQVLPGATRRLQ
jgi:hypothetical protein